ncbi:MAG TPA: phosphate ABC transporter substrate-binding protein [Candidatus Dormibacteraeota bacterium]|nr:phosphate ABC transporter substrate-binding protein [Candidatus Dormibacteraeota bacterium]
MKNYLASDGLSNFGQVPLFFTLLATVGLLVGCSQGSSTAQTKPLQGKLQVKGSNTVGEELAPKLIAEYKKEQPGVTVELESKGTGSGLAALASGQCDVAAASRVVTSAELMTAQSKGIELNAHTIGSYSVAVVVNAANSLKDLTRDQVRDIFTGGIQNWKELKGSDAPIHLYIRDQVSGTYLGFRELAMEDKPYTTNNLTAFTNYASIVEAVAKDPNGIGYCSFDLLSKPGVKGVSIRGVAPDALSVAEGRYPYARILRFYTNKGKESEPALDFVKFVQSSKGQELIAEAGFLPRP